MPREALGDQAQLRRPRLRALWPSAVGWADQVEGARQRVGGALWQGERRKVEIFKFNIFRMWRTIAKPSKVCLLTGAHTAGGERAKPQEHFICPEAWNQPNPNSPLNSAAHSYRFCPFNVSFYLKLWPTPNSGFIFGRCNISSSAICGKARLPSTWKRVCKMSTLWWVTFENLCWDTLSYGFGPSRALCSSVNAHIVWTNRRQSG